MPLAWRTTEGSNPSELPRPSAFEAAAAARQLHDPVCLIHRRRAEQSKPTPGGAHSLAARPGTPVRFTLLACAGRESNPHALRHGHLRPAWLPVTPPARGADD